MASWANLPPGTEVLLLGRFPQLENSQFFNTASSFEVEGIEGPEPRIIVDGTFCFHGRHQRPMSTNLFFTEEGKGEAHLQGASEHVVRFELDRSGTHIQKKARTDGAVAKEPTEAAASASAGNAAEEQRMHPKKSAEAPAEEPVATELPQRRPRLRRMQPTPEPEEQPKTLPSPSAKGSTDPVNAATDQPKEGGLKL
ncbi:unnamed protein product [Symbiodinium sp. CCMP2592]|nr:unnamed protein product [Symbiodinium sp. CCMP2592]